MLRAEPYTQKEAEAAVGLEICNASPDTSEWQPVTMECGTQEIQRKSKWKIQNGVLGAEQLEGNLPEQFLVRVGIIVVPLEVADVVSL